MNDKSKEEGGIKNSLEKSFVWGVLTLVVSTVVATIVADSWLEAKINGEVTSFIQGKGYLTETEAGLVAKDQIQLSIEEDGVLWQEYNSRIDDLDNVSRKNSENVELLSSVIESLAPLPVGMIAFLPGVIDIDSGWRLCDGTELKAGEYSEQLAVLIGKNENGNVKLPNLVNRAIFGAEGNRASVTEKPGTKLELDTSGLYAAITHKSNTWYVHEKSVSPWVVIGRISNSAGESAEGIQSDGIPIFGKINVTSGGTILPPRYMLNAYIKVK